MSVSRDVNWEYPTGSVMLVVLLLYEASEYANTGRVQTTQEIFPLILS